MSKISNTDVGHLEIDVGTRSGCVPRGILRISSDRDDQRIFWGLKFSISGFFWVGKFWQVCFWGSLI